MKGYIAISTSVILSILIMVVAAALGAYSFTSRFGYVDFDNKHGSYSLARSCLDHALLRFAENPLYAGNETVDVSSYQCLIATFEVSGPNTIIKARAQISGATTNLRLTVNTANLSTISLEELTSF